MTARSRDGAAAAARVRRAVLVLAGTLSAACGGEVSGDAQQSAVALFADDSATRARATAQLIALGPASVPLVDPFASGCIRSDSFPARCRNFDRALGHGLAVLVAVGAAPGDTAGAAKQLLWRMLHGPAGDVFDDLGQRDEWTRTDPDSLRRLAVRALARLMALPEAPGAAQAAREAVARVEEPTRRWYLLRNCAGGTMYAGCNYGSYLYGTGGALVSTRIIRFDDPDNFGTGVALRLELLDRGVGVVRSEGGFGGEFVRVTLYRLGPRQTPLCSLEAAAADRAALADWAGVATLTASGCRLRARDPRVRFTPFH